METNMTAIDDSHAPPPRPMNFIQEEDDDDRGDMNDFFRHQQQQPVQQIYQMNDKTKDIFGDFDKTTYIIIFVAFILGFFMGKTMQPVILRPN